MADTKKSTRSATTDESAGGFSETERAAIKERAQELRAAKRGGRKKADDESAVLATIAEMPEPDRGIAERLHAVITDVAPDLAPKLVCPDGVDLSGAGMGQRAGEEGGELNSRSDRDPHRSRLPSARPGAGRIPRGRPATGRPSPGSVNTGARLKLRST